MPKRNAAQIIGELLQAAGRGAGQYYDFKQIEEQERLRKEDRVFQKEQREFWRFQRDKTKKQVVKEEKDRGYLDALLKQFDTPFGMSIPFPGGGAGVEITKRPTDLPEFKGMHTDLARAWRNVYGTEPPASLRGKPMPTEAQLRTEKIDREKMRLFEGATPAEKKKILLGISPPTEPKDERSSWERSLDALWTIESTPADQRTPQQSFMEPFLRNRVKAEGKKESVLTVQGRVIRMLSGLYGDLEWAKKISKDFEGVRKEINDAGRFYVGETWKDILSPEELNKAANSINLPRSVDQAKTRYGPGK